MGFDESNLQVLSEFSVPVDLNLFITQFWSDSQFFARFLEYRLEDLKVHVGEWEEGDVDSNEIVRKISSDHPSNVSFPGLPTHAHSMKTQTIQVYDEEKKMIIKEINDFKGIPYADYFSVIVHWYVFDIDNGDTFECDVKIMLGFQFHKSTWLAGTIESNTRAELKGVYEMWLEEATKQIESLNNKSTDIELASAVSHMPLSNNREVSSPSSVESSSQGIRNRSHSTSTHSQYSDVLNISTHSSSSCMINSKQKQGRKTHLSRVQMFGSSSSSSSSSGNYADIENGKLGNYNGNDDADCNYDYDDDDDDDEGLEFFDCEDTSLLGLPSCNSPSFHSVHSGGFLGDKFLRPKRQTSFDQFNIIPHDLEIEDERISLLRSSNTSYFPPPTSSSSRDIAINLVEFVFVLLEFVYWKMNQFFAHDLKELFDITPTDVTNRIINSMLPGQHGPLFDHPDLYGPIVAVLGMPQVFLLCLEATEQGCDRSDLLGNAVVVSSCLWLGLSTLYRILSFIIAPTISLKHTLSMTGYSFFSWSAAMLTSYPLELYEESWKIPIALPLVIFGIPSALAVAAPFWEATPSSSMTFRPAAFHSSLQSCATSNSRILQKFLWAVPKL